MLAAALQSSFKGARLSLILGILQDKDWPEICRILAPLAARIVLVPVPSERTANPHELADACRQANPRVKIDEHPSLAAALAATSDDEFVTIAGSLYLVGEAMELLGISPAPARDERALNQWTAQPGLGSTSSSKAG
jgi:dihydrofolate synthase/folylpolyglutamate synthase